MKINIWGKINSSLDLFVLQLLNIALRFLKFYFRAETKYQVHSPFVFDFILKVLEEKHEAPIFKEIEGLRSRLYNNNAVLHITDFGAGSKIRNTKEKPISAIAKSAASRPWQCKTLYRLIKTYQPTTLLEMGTSLGISTLYQASAAENGRLITLDGDPAVAEQAEINLDEFKVKNVSQKVGEFSSTLDASLEELKSLDYVFIDGNHRYEPTLDYFEKCLKYAHNDTIFVFDDIHWSKGMEKAWEELKLHPKVTVTIDLFHMGVVFIRPQQKQKEHFTLVPLRWKPFSSLSLGGPKR